MYSSDLMAKTVCKNCNRAFKRKDTKYREKYPAMKIWII